MPSWRQSTMNSQRALGPEPLGLGGHAPQQHVIGPGHRLAELPRAQAAGGDELDLLDQPSRRPGVTRVEVVARPGDPAGDPEYIMQSSRCRASRLVHAGSPAPGAVSAGNCVSRKARAAESSGIPRPAFPRSTG